MQAQGKNSDRGNTSSENTCRVLLAEDDQVNQMAVKKMLEKLSYEVELAGDGKEVLEKIKSGNYDVVLMDVQMPVMDGVEATKEIREKKAGEENADIPIVALTAYAMRGDRDKFINAGMNEYIAKPVYLDDLERVLQKVVKQA